MAGDSPSLRQEDIEELLRQAQMASGLVPDGSTAPAAVPVSAGPPGVAESTEDVAAAATATIAPPAHRPRTAGNSRVGDDVQYLLAQAEQAIASVADPVQSGLPGLTPFELKDLSGAPASGEKATLELLKDVDLDLRIELGRTHMYLEEVLKLKRGSVVTLDKLAGDPVDV